MARPKGAYPYGKGNPGVTTVLNVLAKPGLYYYYWEQGTMGAGFNEHRDKAAAAGTLAHEMIESELRGVSLPDCSTLDPEVVSKAETAYLSFLDWAKLVQFKVIETELSLVDEELHFGGTMDKVSIQDKLCITDFKTSKGGVAYPEMWLQLSAYGHLWNLHNDEKVNDYYLLILDKEQGGFSYHHKHGLAKQWECFTHILRVYHLMKEIKK